MSIAGAQTMHEGIQTQISSHSVDETINRLQAILEERGVKLFCVIDHSNEAAMVGYRMPPTKLLIFGSPKAGTPLMLAAPSTALDLPLKILVAEAADGRVLLSWNRAEWMQNRHGFPHELMANIAAAEMFAMLAAA